MTIGLVNYISKKKIGNRVSFFDGTELVTGTLESLVPKFSVKLTDACRMRLNFGGSSYCVEVGELKDERLMTVGEGRGCR